MPTDWNAELFTKLYSKLALALGVTPREDPELLDALDGPPPSRYPAIGAGVADDPQFLLAIYNPGQYIPANLDPLKREDRYALSVLLNTVPQFSWVYRPAATTVTNAYQSVLDYKEAPLASLSPEQKKKLDAAEATLEEYKDGYDTYREKYWDALDAYDPEPATWVNGGPEVSRSVRRKLEAALKDWDGRGHRQAVDSATAVIAEFEALEPSSFWYRLTERFRGATEETSLGSAFQPIGVSPPYRDWFGDAGWTTFTFEQRDLDNQTRSDAIGVAGNLEGEYGIFRISGDGRYEKDSSFKKVDETRLEFSCQLMRITLDRPWMNPLVLSSRAWQWARGTPLYGTKYSTGGDMAADVPPTGSMTVIPTAAILSKNLVVKGHFEDTVVNDLNNLIKANASVGIGPFAVAGQFNMEDHTGSIAGTIATNGIQAEDVQIIALVCQMLPECPNPDPSLDWPA